MADREVRVSTHLGYFGTGADRYNPSGYRKADAALERLYLVAGVHGLNGVELNYPALVNEETVDDVRATLAETGLAVSNVSLNLWGAPAGVWVRSAAPTPVLALRLWRR